MGHALNASIQDLLDPLASHAGLLDALAAGLRPRGDRDAERRRAHLAKEGLTRHDLGREAFVERTWEWLEHYGGVIIRPVPPARRLARLPARALHHGRGLRAGRYDVLRAPARAGPGSTAPTASSTGARAAPARSPISRSTTSTSTTRSTRFAIRSRTAPGISPSPRCGRRRCSPTSPSPSIRTTSATGDLVGREAIVPVVDRRVPIVEDDRVDPEFGTGAVKITPGHDPMDFDIGRDPRPAGARP